MIMAPSLQRMWISFPEKKQKLERCCTITELCSKSEICHVKLRGNFLGEDLNPFFFIRRFINHVRKQLLQSSGAASGLSCVFLDDLVLSPFYLNKFWVMMLRKASSSPYSGRSSAASASAATKSTNSSSTKEDLLRACSVLSPSSTPSLNALQKLRVAYDHPGIVCVRR